MENKMLDLEGLRHYDTKIKADVDGKLANKQDSLVSGTNIKTINGTSILGEGNITIEAGAGAEVAEITDEEIGNLFETGILETKYVSQESIQEAINTEY